MLTPAEFLQHYRGIGERKANAPCHRLFILALLAGFFIGMGGAVTNTASHMIANASIARLLNGLLFPFGLIMVMLTGAELFTGNCLMTISVLERQISAAVLLKNWAIVYLGNFAGAALLAAACVYSGQLNLSNGALATATIQQAAAKCSLSFGRAVVLGILCNVLVCTAVMCALCATSVPGRAVGAFFPVAFFVICGFEHCVANMYYIPAGLFASLIPQYRDLALGAGANLSALNLTGFLLGNLFPVTLGNLLGGCAFAALVWYGHGKRD